MDNYRLAKNWAVVAGVVLVLVGVVGFVPNPLVSADPNALVPVGTVHNLVHLLTGAIALYIAFGLRGPALVNGVIGFGVLYAVIFVVVLLSPTLFGLFEVPANMVLHVIHFALAAVSLAVGYMARSGVRTGDID